MFSHISPQKGTWGSTTTGVSGINYVFAAGSNFARTEIYISKGEAEENEWIFDTLEAQKDAIESITEKLVWQRLPGKKACSIKREINDVDIHNMEDWPRMSEFFTENML